MKSLIRLLADKSTYIVVVVGLLGLAITAVVGFVTGKAAVALVAFGIGPSALILLIVMSARLDMVHDKLAERDLSIGLLVQQIRVLEGVLRESMPSSRRPQGPFMEFLNNAYDFYKGLNTARAESSSSILVMKIHHKGPQDVGVVIGGSLPEEKLTNQTLLQEQLWYNGLREWNVAGRTVERITVRRTASMNKFVDDTLQLMKGTQYLAHIIDWDGNLPLLNLCIFDLRQVLITFSTDSAGDPYMPMRGVRIKDPQLATFLYHEYYKRLADMAMTERPTM
jgi:hypothetical protein